jgi:hypothetical protein
MSVSGPCADHVLLLLLLPYLAAGMRTITLSPASWVSLKQQQPVRKSMCWQ